MHAASVQWGSGGKPSRHSTSHTRSVQSSLTDASWRPSLLKATDQTVELWPTAAPARAFEQQEGLDMLGAQ
jgi:hypothetical protein